jgi:DNA-binding response OmpR family regulator
VGGGRIVDLTRPPAMRSFKEEITEMRILLVEDDRKIGQFVKKGLEEVAYACTWVRSCQEAESAVADAPFDIIILDVGLPDGSGLQLLTQWRGRELATQVLILSARHEVDDKIAGLNLGADDYLTKPFSFGELLARLRSLVRRHGTQKKTVLEHRGVRLDLLKREATLDGVPVTLTQREFALIEYFLQNPARVLTRTQIAEKIWDCHFDMETNLVDVYVAKLRGKLKRANERESLFQSVRGVGYKFA